MKYKIIRVHIINKQGKRSSIKLNKTVQDIEQLRRSLRDQYNAHMVLFHLQETNE